MNHTNKFQKLTLILLCLAMVLTMSLTVIPMTAFAATPTPLTFTAEADTSSVKLNYNEGTNVMYKLGSAGWVAYKKGTSIELDKNETVSFKGTGVDTDYSNHFSMTGKIAASGDVTSLTNGIGGDTTLNVFCCYYMFYGCTSLTKAPELPATTLAYFCYNGMFTGCTSLTTVPELPATTLDYGCYFNMFFGCTSLTTPPELPATTLTRNCYSGMFNGCTRLTTAPKLPATTLAYACYSGLFSGCTSLAEVPELPATTLTDHCYNGMFYGCTSLTKAPELPATTLANYCYNGMFYGCTSLKISATKTGDYTKEWRIPTTETITTTVDGWNKNMLFETGGTFTDNPEVNITYYIYERRPAPLTFTAKADGSSVTLNFVSGTNVMVKLGSADWAAYAEGTEISLDKNDTVSFKGNGVTTNLSNHFSMTGKIAASGDVTSLTNGIGGDATLSDFCYYGMFSDCASLTAAPELPATMLANNCYYFMFYDCTSLTKAPELPATALATYCYNGMFYDCTGLTTAPELPATTLADYCYYRMFDGCTSLTEAPKLPAITMAAHCYQRLFYGCASLTTPPKLPATTLADHCYYYMFDSCTGLTTAPELPATTLADHCYNSMFYGCTSLTAVPELNATTLTDYCYYRMFYGCTSLKISDAKSGDYTIEWCIPTTGTITSTADSWNIKMLSGTGGTFTENPKENTTYYIYEDNTQPVVSGIENGKTYCETAEFTVTDDNLNAVTINETISTASDGNYKLIASGTNTVVATDKAGNSTTVKVIINENHTYDNDCDATCKVCAKPRTAPHSWETEWSSDGTNHWHECSLCDEKKDIAAHTPDEDDNDCTTAVNCTICNVITTDAQSHVFTGAYDGHDETHHWHICNRDGCDGIDTKVLHSGGTATYFEQATCAGCGQKYGSTMPDVTAPTGGIVISPNHWNEFLNTVTFGLFFKETKTVTVTANDSESGIAKIEYLLSDTVFSSENVVTGTWNDITATKQFNLNPNSKQYIYVRLSDEDDNIAIINSEGVVIYYDSTVSVETATFDKNVDNQADIAFTMSLNGNTLKDIKYGTTMLTSDTDYTVSGDTITVKKAYFAAQANGTVTLTFSFYPMGVEDNENLSTATAPVTVIDSTHIHIMSHIIANSATCTADGNVEYWHCGGCDKYFSDAAGNTEIIFADTVVSKLTKHTFDKEVVDGRYLKSVANCESAAVYYKSCACGELGTETFTSGDKNPTNHSSLAKTGAVPATHLAVGNTDYWHCGGCDKYFSDAAGTTEITIADTVVSKLTEHTFDREVVDGKYLKSEVNCESAAVYYKSCACGEHGTETFTSGDKNPANHTSLVKIDAVPATHLAVGNTEYWYCGGCNKYFSNAAGTTEITLADTVVAKQTEHTAVASKLYSDEDGHWHICTCGDKIDVASHIFGEWTVLTEATATEKGSKERICSACGYKETAEIPVTGGSPKTGDNSNLWLLIALLCLSVGAVTVLGITGKRRRAVK